jgi:hypothetical protein
MTNYDNELIKRLRVRNESLEKRNKQLSKDLTKYKAAMVKINGVSMRVLHDD